MWNTWTMGSLARLGAIDKRLCAFDEHRHVFLTPIGAMAKRRLGIDNEQCGIGSGHFMPPWHEGMEV